MIAEPISIKQAAAWADGTIVGTQSICMHSIAIDSRVYNENTLFIALPGHKTDGHNFVLDFLKQPTRVAMIRQEFYETHTADLLHVIQEYDSALIVVPDPLRSLGNMARAYLQQFSDQIIIAITGSTGKTTTKELMKLVLERVDACYATKGNSNSAIGVPLNAFAVHRKMRYLIFEAGTGYPGEIYSISKILQPHYVLITNIGNAHIGLFGSQSAIAAEKISLALESSNLKKLFISSQDNYSSELLNKISGEIIYYDALPETDFEFVSALKESRVKVGNRYYSLPIIGHFQHKNIRAVIALACALGCNITQIIESIRHYTPPFGRLEYLEGDISIVQDCYNASPESMFETLNFFHHIKWDARKIVLLGAMKELGEKSAHFHRHMLLYISQLHFDYIICFGEEYRNIYTLLSTHQTVYCEHIEDIQRILTEELQNGDILLLKGSRANRLERITDYLKAQGWLH